MSGLFSRTKGHAFERWLARWFRAHGYPDAKRGFQYRDGKEAADIIGVPWFVECKRIARKPSHNQLCLWFLDATDRACNGMVTDKPVIVVYKIDRQPVMFYDGTTSKPLEELVV